MTGDDPEWDEWNDANVLDIGWDDGEWTEEKVEAIAELVRESFGPVTHGYYNGQMFSPSRPIVLIDIEKAHEEHLEWFNRVPLTVCADCQYEDRNGHAPDCENR
jgi:hypothetical protein